MALIKCEECGAEVSSKAPACPACGNPTGGASASGPGGSRAAGKVGLGCLGCFGLCVVMGVIGQIVNPTPRHYGPRANDGASKGGTSQKAPPNPQGPAKPEVVIEPSRLAAEYDSNEVAADNRYKGKVVRLTGTVEDIGKDLMDSIYVTLRTGHSFRKVQVFFSDEHNAAVAKLNPGDRIKIQGECGGLMMNVLIKDASFVR